MKLTQALGRRSWWPPGEISMPDCPRTSDPDKHGGWFLNTWYISAGLLQPKTGRPGSPVAGQGAWILHTYTEAERSALLAAATDSPVRDYYGNAGFVFDGVTYNERFRGQLVALLSDPNDLPVYYTAD